MTTRTQITIVALSVLAIAMIPISAPQARRLPSRRRCPTSPARPFSGVPVRQRQRLTAFCGDGDALFIDQSLAGGDPGVQASLRASDNQLRLRFDPAGSPTRTLTAFLAQRLTPLQSFECSGNCLAADDNGNPISNTPVTVEVRDGQDARIQTTMYDGQGRIIIGGPGTLAVGQSAPISILIGFEDPNGNGYRWGLYWSPVNYPGSDLATITRTSACTWDLEAFASDVAGLRLFNTGRGSNSTRSEGRFLLPFKFTFSADAAGMPGGCGS